MQFNNINDIRLKKYNNRDWSDVINVSDSEIEWYIKWMYRRDIRTVTEYEKYFNKWYHIERNRIEQLRIRIQQEKWKVIWEYYANLLSAINRRKEELNKSDNIIATVESMELNKLVWEIEGIANNPMYMIRNKKVWYEYREIERNKTINNMLEMIRDEDDKDKYNKPRIFLTISIMWSRYNKLKLSEQYNIINAINKRLRYKINNWNLKKKVEWWFYSYEFGKYWKKCHMHSLIKTSKTYFNLKEFNRAIQISFEEVKKQINLSDEFELNVDIQIVAKDEIQTIAIKAKEKQEIKRELKENIKNEWYREYLEEMTENIEDEFDTWIININNVKDELTYLAVYINKSEERISARDRLDMYVNMKYKKLCWRFWCFYKSKNKKLY